MDMIAASDSNTLPDTAWLHALASIPRVGNKTLLVLLRHFHSGTALWDAVLDENIPLPGIRPQTLTALRTNIHTLDPEMLWDTLAATGVEAIGYTDLRFPPLLREIPDAPVILYTRGTYDWLHKTPLITIVGTRKPSNYGRQVVTDFARRLSQSGFTVISGLAFGIDSLAHQAVLENHGKTIAVIGSGVDDVSVSPQSHLPLARRIIESNGALVSEFVPGTQASTGTFPARNRIMAGMSPMTLVIEASEQSGTLITARLALEYNRDVGAIPGSLFSEGAIGCHRLIQRGAKLITSIEDILEEFPSLEKNTPLEKFESIALPDNEKELWMLITNEPLHIDQIIAKTKKSASEITTILTMLEMKGLAKNIGGMHYIKIQQ